MAFSAPDPDEARTAAESTGHAESTSTGPGSPADVPVEHPRSPLLAALGAGEVAVAAVARAFADAFSAATSTQKTVQQRVAELPTELEELRGRFSGDELRRALEAYRVQVERAYAEFAGRGEEAWGRLREQPQVRQAITNLEAYTGKLDARVDDLVGDAQDAAARALAVANRQTHVTGEKLARAGQRFSGRAADTVVDVSAAASDAAEAASDAVEEAGTATASAIEDVGDETAAVTRKATRAKPESGPSGTRSTAKRPATPRRAPRSTPPASE
jgi:heparin binding hemagglutinin HbhA